MKPSCQTLWLLACLAVGPLGCTSTDGPAAPGAGSGASSGQAVGGSGASSGQTGDGGAAGNPWMPATDGSISSPPADGNTPTDGAGTAVEGAASPDGAMGSLGQDGPSEGSASDASGLCKTAGTELCDGFESGSIDSAIWGMHVPTQGASVTVDTQHAHSGNYALHVKLVPGQANTAEITDAVTFPAKNNTFYTRAFFYFSPDVPSGGYHLAALLATGNNDLGFVQAGLGVAADRQYVGYSEYYGSGPGNTAHGATFTEFGPDSNTRVVPMAWICLELMQGSDAAMTTTMRRVWVDGKELPEQVSNYNGRKAPKFDLMSIGILQYHASPTPSDVWVDDVRVSSSGPIGCSVP
jgi:hypothetical protein